MKTQEIADFLSAEIVGDGTVEISGIASVTAAVESEIAFFEKSEMTFESRASCLLVPLDFCGETSQPHIHVKDPKLAFTLVAQKLQKHQRRYFGKNQSKIASSADVRTLEIGAFVTIGEHSYIGEGCQIADGVRVGRNVTIKNLTVIHPNCVIYDNVEIGNNCVIHAGTVIGSDGFGYVKNEVGEHVQFPQIGSTIIGNNVEIGSNCSIDRGSLGTTRIDDGTKIDNLVQIAHNVQIGKRVLIAAQSGIAGSSVIEDDVTIAGQVGIADHVTIKAGAVIGAKSAVFPHKIVRPGVWSGIPVKPLDEYRLQNAHLKGLKKLKDDVKNLKKQGQSGK